MTRLPESEIEAARANVAIYSRYVALKRSGAWLIGRCPLHDDLEPSFGIRNGRWKCFAGCGYGSTIDFLMRLQHLDFAEAVHELAGDGRAASRLEGECRKQPPQRVAAPVPSSRETQPIIKKLWEEADQPRIAELYLWSRAIRVRPKPLPWSLRGHARVWCKETQERRPAVLAALSAPDGTITALQRCWVETSFIEEDAHRPKGTRAIDLKAGKKTLGTMGSGAVRLGEPWPIMGIAEGFETALSAAHLFGIPVWASLGAHRMGEIELPDVARTVLICGDNGAAGEKAARAAISAYRKQGREVSLAFPKPSYGDFNEQLMAR
jgi:putative DNA primase/helicase